MKQMEMICEDTNYLSDAGNGKSVSYALSFTITEKNGHFPSGGFPHNDGLCRPITKKVNFTPSH